jgi:hypothetical protein
MTPHERELILKAADEVRAADRSAIDAEAERLIRSEVAAQPHAAYILTQRVIVQELALRQARARIEELEARQGGRAGSGSFLGGAAGTSPVQPGQPRIYGQPQPYSHQQPTPSPQYQPPQAGQPQGGGSAVGGFLKTAAAAAAGTIGGQLIYDGIRNWSAGHGGGGGFFGGGQGQSPGGFSEPGTVPIGGGGYVPTSPVPASPGDRGNQDWGGGGDFDSTDAQDTDTGAGGEFGGQDEDDTQAEDAGSGGGFDDTTDSNDTDNEDDWGDQDQGMDDQGDSGDEADSGGGGGW